jgi:DUF1680 family protein
MPAELIEANPNVLACTGKVALHRGPILYGFEGFDNAGDGGVELAPRAVLELETRPDFPGGVTVIKATPAGGQARVAVPFYSLANREKPTQEDATKQS